VVVSIHPEKQDEFLDFMMETKTEFNMLGEVTPSNIVVDGDDWGDVKEWREEYDNAIGNMMMHSVEATEA
jgi:phosphoribosylformylglycinamidine synthase